MTSSDRIKEFEEVLKKAEAGDAQAQFQVGLHFDIGIDVITRNYEKGLKYYLMAAEQDHSDAMVSASRMYRLSRGVEQNYGEALKWLEKAADLNNEDAYDYLSLMYRDGLGVKKNEEESKKWLEKKHKKGSLCKK